MEYHIDGGVNGKTFVMGVIGNPIGHTFSPQIHNTAAKILGIDMIYIPFKVEENTLGEAIAGARALGIVGLNVTIPHKKNVMKYLTFIDQAASRIGAVNTLKLTPDGYAGYNTDITGVIETMASRGISAKGKKTAVIGAGGSAAASAFALAETGAKSVNIFNRTINSAETLAKNLKQYYDIETRAFPISDADAISESEIIILSTHAGFGADEGNLPEGINAGNVAKIFKNAEFVLEVVYVPWETALLKEAKKCCPVCANGFDMLIYQGIAAFDIFTGGACLDAKFNAEKFRDELEKYYINMQK